MAMLKIPDKFAQARGGWSSDRVMKRVYQETFEKERINVDSAMDEYFSDEIIPEANEKYNTDQYRSFLKLLKKIRQDPEKNSMHFVSNTIFNMQHKMQHTF